MFTPEDYRNIVIRSMPRVFHSLDRNPSSPTYGCFDRAYWHHRKTDYPISTAQMLMAVAAHLYKNSFEGNPYYRAPGLLNWIKASLSFTINIQHKDGSYDEWYPNERGWAGPTGYVAHAICETLDHIEDELEPDFLRNIHISLLKSAEHLNARDEKDILANHYAITLLPLFEIYEKTSSKKVLEMYQCWKKKFLGLQTSEGWFLEYDGCDPGYTLGTADFLASLHRKNPDPEIQRAACAALDFLAYFAYPDGSWAGSLGSRHTTHSYPFALEYWSKYSESAKALLAHFRKGISQNSALSPNDQEDHYLPYRLKDYLKAAEFFVPLTEQHPLPYEERSFHGKSFPLGKFEIISSDSYLAWIACGRGGALKVFEKKQKKLIYANCGAQVLDPNGECFSSLWQGSEYSFSKDSLLINGNMERIFLKRFRPSTFLLFRLACLLIPNRRVAYFFKVMIRRFLITHKQKSSYQWRRELLFLPNEVKGKDTINRIGIRNEGKIFFGGEFHNRYVPQGNYFSPAELRFFPKKSAFQGRIQAVFAYSVSTKNEKIEECAE